MCGATRNLWGILGLKVATRGTWLRMLKDRTRFLAIFSPIDYLVVNEARI